MNELKRVIFAAALLVFVIGFNVFCVLTITGIKNESAERLDFLAYTVETGNTDKTVSECEKFSEYWLSKQHILGRIVRHELLDQTSMAVSQFLPLARHENYGELSAEISRCRFLIEEIWDSELPLLRNIL